jgi:hypothetical protein
VIAGQRGGKFVNKRGDGAVQPLSVDPLKVVEVMKDRRAHDICERESVVGLPHLRLEYERDLLQAERHRETCGRVYDFLGLDSAPVTTQHVRASFDRVSDYVENHEELIAVVRAGGFEVAPE